MATKASKTPTETETSTVAINTEEDNNTEQATIMDSKTDTKATLDHKVVPVADKQMTVLYL